jgi:hypothetical protein
MSTLKERMQELREKIKNRPKKRMITPPPPRYDDVYFEGMRWLDWLAHSESLNVCIKFQKDEDTMCWCRVCPCDKYTPENKNT